MQLPKRAQQHRKVTLHRVKQYVLVQTTNYARTLFRMDGGTQRENYATGTEYLAMTSARKTNDKEMRRISKSLSLKAKWNCIQR